jgi:ABC-2 type transport system permease protein
VTTARHRTVDVGAPDDVVPGGWRRYARIIAICWRAAVAEQLEYRADLVAKTLMSAFWLAWAALGVSVYFRFAGDIGGWSYGEVLVVVGLFFALNGTRQAFLEPNLERLGEGVRRGTLDHLLTRPVDSQLLVSLRHVDMHNLVDPVLGLVLVSGGVVASGRAVTVGGLGGFLLLGVAALVLLYALVLALMCLSVLLVGAEELSTVSFSVVELSRFPVQAYRQPLQTLLVVVPVAFLTTLPAEALLGRLEPMWLVVSPLVALAGVAGASVGWRRVLRRYTGASA